jgi:hypothetical protein
MRQAIAVLVLVTVPAFAEPVRADPIPIRSGFVALSFDESEFSAHLAGPGFEFVGRVIPGPLPCFGGCVPGETVDASSTHTLIAGVDLFGFVGSIKLNDIQSSSADGTLTFAAAPFRLQEDVLGEGNVDLVGGFAPFTMRGHVRALRDDGTVLAERDVSGRGTVRFFEESIFTDVVDYDFESFAATPEPCSLALVGLGMIAACCRRRLRP